jgi:hypothetical protein
MKKRYIMVINKKMLKFLIVEVIEESRKHSTEEYSNVEAAVSRNIKKYGADKIYVHFSKNFYDFKKQMINQVGLNVHQNYGNPFGIYAYPASANFAGMFKTNADYAYI